MRTAQIVISLVLIFSFAGAGASLDAKFDGSGRIRYQNSDNLDFNDALGDREQGTASRFRLGVELESGEETIVYIQAQYVDTWGSNSGRLSDNSLSVHQAYIKHQINSRLELKLGRQELAYGDHLVVGSVGWSNVGRSFDAAKLKYKHSLGWVDVFASEVTKISPGEDNNFSGLYASFDKLNFADVVEFYTFYSVNPAFVLDADVIHFGTRVKSQEGLFDYRVEVTAQSEVSGHQGDLELGYKFTKESRLRFSLEGFMASKDYIQLFPTAHKWLGIRDILSRRNIIGARVGVQMKVSDKLKAKVDYHLFQRQDDAVSAYAFNGSSLGTSGSSKDIGSELDATISYKLDEKLSALIGGGLFIVGDYLKENGRTDNSSFLFAQIQTKF